MIERRVIVTDCQELLSPGIELLQHHGVDTRLLAAGEGAKEAGEAPVVLVGTMPFQAAEIAALRRTGLLVRAGGGYDIVDLEAATRAGVWVANVPDYGLDEVADHTLLMLLGATRHLGELTMHWRGGSWTNDRLPEVHRIRGQTLGIVGMGRIGSRVAYRARAFGWEVVECSPRNGEGLDTLFAGCDAITLHCPLTATTRHLVNRSRLDLARPGLVLVNTSRGGLVDLDALELAMAAGRVAAAALDVVDGEPTPDLDHPLLKRPEVLVTPHVAWYSWEARRDLAIKSAEECLRYLDGSRPLNLLNPQARATAG